MATIAARRVPSDRFVRGALPQGAVASVGAIAGVLTAAGLGLDGLADPDAWSVARGLVVASYVAVGTYTWARRPASGFGPVLVLAGLLYAVAALSASHDALLHTVGRVALAVTVVYLAYVFLCFPRDRLGSRTERRLVGAFAAASVVVWLVALPLVETLPVGGPLVDCGAACPDNAARLVTVPDGVSSALGFVVNAVTAIALLGVIALLVDRARSPARLRRRLVVPVLTAAVGLAASYAAYTLLRGAGAEELDVLRVFGAVAALGIPAGMLVGQVRGRVFAATSLVELVGRVGGQPVSAVRVEALLRQALGDPLLRIALRAPGAAGYVDVQGRPLDLPARNRDVAVTPITHEGRPVAALFHDAALDEGSGITEGLAATALMLLENAQLVEELRASRARIVASEQRERLRLERDLHDGAQQRLFDIQLRLAAARGRATDPELAQDLDELTAETAATVDELRTLAHGLYPTVLRERGLADGLRARARATGIPVRVVADGIGRCREPVEEAVYFCALEAIQNAAKHAGPGAHVVVELERAGADLRFSIADDGAGFERDPDTEGIGLVSMRDRIGAVGGTVEVVSRPGRGTAVHGHVPDCRPRAGDGAGAGAAG